MTRFSMNQIRKLHKMMKRVVKKAMMIHMMMVGLVVMIFIQIHMEVDMACNIRLLSHKIRNHRREETAQLEVQL